MVNQFCKEGDYTERTLIRRKIKENSQKKKRTLHLGLNGEPAEVTYYDTKVTSLN
jgi:hypothetical protein